MTEDVKFTLSADDAKAKEALGRTEAGLDAVGAAAKRSSLGFKTAAREASGLGTATVYTRQQMQQLSFQMTDIWTSLASGQSPFTVLLQQGGQLRDAFGSTGGAVRAIASTFTLARVAAFGLVGGLAAATTAAAQGWREAIELRDSLALTGIASGQTAASFERMAVRVSAASRVTVSAAKELVGGAINSGAFGPRAVAVASEAMARVQKLSGQTSAEVVKHFATMQGGVAKWAAETNRAYNFLTIEQFKFIQRLEKQGDAQGAALETLRLLNTELGSRLPRNLGYLESAWEGVTNKASEAWNAMLGLGREESLNERVDRLRNALSVSSTRGGGPLTDASRARRQPGDEAELNTANRDLLRQTESAITRAYAAIATQKAIEDAQKTPKTFDQLFPRANVAGIIGSASEAARLRQNEAGSAGSIEQFLQERNQKEYDAEKERQATLANLQDEYAADWADRQAYLLELAKPEWQRLAEHWENTTQAMAEAGKRFTDGFVDAGRDAFQEFMRTGQVSAEGFKSLVIQTLTELIYDRILAKNMGTLADLLWNYLGQGFSGGGWGFGGSGASGGGGAGGGSMPMPEYAGLSAGASRKRATGAGVTINQTINVGQGVNSGELYAAMRVAKDAAVAEVENKITRGNRLYDRGASA